MAHVQNRISFKVPFQLPKLPWPQQKYNLGPKNETKVPLRKGFCNGCYQGSKGLNS